MTENPRVVTPEMIAEADPPAGFEPIRIDSPFGWVNGPLFEKDDAEGYKRGFRVAFNHLNPGRMCHGGMIMTFADILLASAVFKVVKPPLVTVRMTTDFIGPAFEGDWMEGFAWLSGGEDGLYSVAGHITANGRDVASASGVFKQVRRRNQ